MPLTLQEFQRAFEDPEVGVDVIRRLGALGPWILRAEHRRRFASLAGQKRLQCPPAIGEENCRPGGCCPVIVSGQGEASILDDGFLLPVHWKTDGTHDLRLPALLRDTADQVRQVLDAPDASLHLMLPDQEGPREEVFPDAHQGAGFESAFAALACGLRMLQVDQAPDYRTAATGKWDGRLVQVGHLQQKTRAVAEFPRGGGQRRIVNWYVPEGENAAEADRTLEDLQRHGSKLSLNVRTLSALQPHVLRALAPLFASAGLRPDDQADPSVLQAYYQWLQSTDPGQAEDYYSQVLYQQICRRALADPGPMEPRPTHLVSVVSSPALIGLADQLLQFQHILVLYTVPEIHVAPAEPHGLDFAQRAQQVKQLIDGGADKCSLRPFVYRAERIGHDLLQDVAQEMAEPIRSFLDGIAPGRVMWDTTSGLRLFSHTLEKRFARPGDWMLYLHHQWSARTNQRVPLTESVLIWKHGQPW
jgi:hypothetical protein